MYYDCVAEEEVWSRVMSVRRVSAVDDEDDADSEDLEVDANRSVASVTLVLGSGRELVVDAANGELHLVAEHRTQELCGELECASLELKASTIAQLERRAAEILGDASSRRLQRGGGCRRCGGGGGRGRRRRRTPNPIANPVPTPPPVSVLPIAETAEQQAVIDAAAVVTQIFSSATNLADTLGGIVRLAFHDAGTFDSATNTGGADGCIDLAGSENNGLAAVIDVFEPAVTTVQGRLSRADVWALAAGMAVEYAGGPALQFHVGRIDSSSCTGHAARLPNAELGHSHIIDVFITKMSFTERETAALMGAHVLGRATRSVSGYDGNWVPNNDRFTNDYFRDLLERPWNRMAQPRVDGQSRTQWNGPRNTMMLNTDIEIAFDTSDGCTRAGGGRPGGRGAGGGGPRGGGPGGGGPGGAGPGGGPQGSCPRAPGSLSDSVTEFAARRGGQAAFFEAFAPAFTKLMSLGAGDLTCPFSDCNTPGPF